MGKIVFTRGKEWWISKTGSGKTNRRRQYYPDLIRVGKLGKERVYVPERTCRDVSEPPKDGGFWPTPHFKCSECGEGHISMDYVYYCPNCGARVIDV